MDQKSLLVRRAQWAQVVQDGNNAPISKKEWCAQNGINLKAFYYWQNKLRKQAIETAEQSTALQVQVAQPASFVEIPVQPVLSREHEVPKPATRIIEKDHELVLQVDDYQLFINENIKERTLRTVMKVLRHA